MQCRVVAVVAILWRVPRRQTSGHEPQPMDHAVEAQAIGAGRGPPRCGILQRDHLDIGPGVCVASQRRDVWSGTGIWQTSGLARVGSAGHINRVYGNIAIAWQSAALTWRCHVNVVEVALQRR